MVINTEQAEAALRQMLEGPAMSPPAGAISNFHDPSNLDAFVALTVTLCMGIGTLAVALRLYTKVFILRVLAWEDCRFSSLSLHFGGPLTSLDVIVLAWVKWPTKVDRSRTEISRYLISERLSRL